jgi:hypothetical protein
LRVASWVKKTYCPIDTFNVKSYGLHSTTSVLWNGYVYDSLMINNVCFRNIEIIESNKRKIGFQFFKRFNKVFLNTKEKEFCFY